MKRRSRSELEEQLVSLDAFLLLRERAASDAGQRHCLVEVATKLGGDDRP
jgi:hypothetical protein